MQRATPERSTTKRIPLTPKIISKAYLPNEILSRRAYIAVRSLPLRKNKRLITNRAKKAIFAATMEISHSLI